MDGLGDTLNAGVCGGSGFCVGVGLTTGGAGDGIAIEV